MTYVEKITDFLFAFDPPDPTWTPGSVSMGYAVYLALRDDYLSRNPRTEMTSPTALLGLRVERDDSLPANVWRLHTADGRLIHDSRSGRKLSS